MSNDNSSIKNDDLENKDEDNDEVNKSGTTNKEKSMSIDKSIVPDEPNNDDDEINNNPNGKI